MLGFKKKEIRDILISIGVLALAVSGLGPNWVGAGVVIRNLVSVSFPLALSFFTHELAHKKVALSYGYRSYYRMWGKGLILALLIGIMSNGELLFAAPGAVMIQTRNAGSEENGKISAAGPLTNLILAGLFYPFTLIPGLLSTIGQFGVFINLWLAIFNLLPFGPLDGRKIFNWEPKIGISMLGIAGFLMFLMV